MSIDVYQRLARHFETTFTMQTATIVRTVVLLLYLRPRQTPLPDPGLSWAISSIEIYWQQPITSAQSEISRTNQNPGISL
jgi:hypothetical protein